MLTTILIRAALAATALALPSSAGTRDWIYVSNTSGGKNSLDRASVVVKAGIATFWTKSEFVGEQRAEWGGATIETNEQIDCARNHIRLLEYVAFDEAGTELSRDRMVPPDSDWIRIKPGTFAREKQQIVCPA